jgi:hypothetical protein
MGLFLMVDRAISPLVVAIQFVIISENRLLAEALCNKWYMQRRALL